MSNGPTPDLVSGLAELAPSYRALLCDVWGIIHNGVEHFPVAVAALGRYRAEGGVVLLITNAPRPSSVVVQQLDKLGVSRDGYDGVVTSGEAARAFLSARPGLRLLHVGPPRDLPLYDGLPVELTDEATCGMVSCTGLFDDECETPDDYVPSFARWLGRGLPLLCSNPDIKVIRGDRPVWCAGGLADRYRRLGGETIIVGKPHARVYETALDRLAEIVGSRIAKIDVLALGDGLETDVRGAVDKEIDVVFVIDGVHGAAFGNRRRPDVAAVHRHLREKGLGARALMTHLAWEGAP